PKLPQPGAASLTGGAIFQPPAAPVNHPVAMPSEAAAIPVAEADRKFDEIDANHDGVISREEFRAVFAHQQAAGAAATTPPTSVPDSGVPMMNPMQTPGMMTPQTMPVKTSPMAPASGLPAMPMNTMQGNH